MVRVLADEERGRIALDVRGAVLYLSYSEALKVAIFLLQALHLAPSTQWVASMRAKLRATYGEPKPY